MSAVHPPLADDRPEIEVEERPLSQLAADALAGYFAKLNGQKPAHLYDFVLREVEKPLLEAVLKYTSGNQSHAAEVLGINRGTLRKKLRMYNLLG